MASPQYRDTMVSPASTCSSCLSHLPGCSLSTHFQVLPLLGSFLTTTLLSDPDSTAGSKQHHRFIYVVLHRSFSFMSINPISANKFSFGVRTRMGLGTQQQLQRHLRAKHSLAIKGVTTQDNSCTSSGRFPPLVSGKQGRNRVDFVLEVCWFRYHFC